MVARPSLVRLSSSSFRLIFSRIDWIRGVTKGCTAPVVPAKDWRIERVFGKLSLLTLYLVALDLRKFILSKY